MATKPDGKKPDKDGNGKKHDREGKEDKQCREEFVRVLTAVAEGAHPTTVRRLLTRMLLLTGPATPTITSMNTSSAGTLEA